ncbi:hypothetical protein SAMN05421776_106108 [Nocardia farcinica]|uniref:Secreted protein n=1 Tax=Nocardia farcinica TaxID=37329 RepID=A0A0H5P496_NOCFR|nr:hypothetical protein [Nocardia farcinica]AXK87851.1 hypothetical protein DXT66_21510 [Nocardia farcinica]CRY82655.1 Uncharacterised protein [Nocardia farcinica]SIT26222.1 hypothetical protein SAMN05421776_106108 [Nocardia farcinica]
MRQTHRARIAAVLAGAAATVVLGSGAQAEAETIPFPDVPTMARGGLCWTSVQTWADTDPRWPGRAVLNMRATPVGGIGPGRYPFAPLCEVRATAAWRNLDTGATGAFDNIVVTGIYGSIQYALFQDTGPGRVEVTVTTDAPSIPAKGLFVVPA